jgi:FkbM family methyltransferase
MEVRQILTHLTKSALRTRGYEILRVPNLGDFLRSRDCDLVVDVGANAGQFASKLRPLGYRGAILSIEPLDDVIGELQAKAAPDPLWIVKQVAIGDRPGRMEINVSRNTVYSSILPLADLAQKFANTEITRTQAIDVDTLDNVLAEVPGKRPFIKIDTQGFEQQVLAGAARTLERCVGLLLELPVEHLYEGVWSFPQAIVHLEQLGFRLAQILPVNCRAEDAAAALEFDCVFRRDDQPATLPKT